MPTLKEMRLKRGVMTKAAANALNMSRQAYYQQEQHPWTLKFYQAKALCDFLHCDPSEISDFYLPEEVDEINDDGDAA